MTTHERPGVYSAYDASAVVSGSAGAKWAGVAAQCSAGTAGKVYALSDYSQAVDAFGANQELTRLVHLLFQNGAAGVYAVPVGTDADYAGAFAALNEVEAVRVMVCDSTTLTTQQAMRQGIEAASDARRERIGVVAGGAGESVTQLVSRAASLNSRRMVLIAPEATDAAGTACSGIRAAAAAAGAIAGERDPAVPLGGAVLKGLPGLSARYSDAEIDTLVRGGVTPLESVGGEISVVRAVTTRTTSGGAADTTWRELTTILIVDDVIPSLRDALRSRFRRAKNTEQSRGAIRAQVVLELENKLAREIITGYDNVTVRAMEDNPTVCLVEFSFTVAHGLNQIWLSAHITV